MPKKGKSAASASRGDGRNSDCINDLTVNMPMARALKDNDSDALGALISSALPGNPIISDVVIKKSVGEAFTGGRSTPVYYITCTIRRPKWPEGRERYFVAKLVEMPGNDINDARLQKRRESYAVERRFYDVAAPRIRDSQTSVNLEIPRLLASDRDGSRPHPAVCFLMNDVRQRGFDKHPDFLSVSEAKRALKWAATLHAMFWNDDKTLDWRRDLWKRGGFWTDGKDVIDANKISSQWSQTARWMQTSFGKDVKGLGKRLQNIAFPLDQFLSLESASCRGTLIHGDFKAANLFFKAIASNCDDHGPETVAAVDFQFAGTGLPAEDVAYLLFPDARGHFEEHQDELLKVYHEELIACLIAHRKGGPSSLPFHSFVAYYQLSRIDFVQHLLGKGWVASNPGDAALVEALEKTLFQIDQGKNLESPQEYLQKLASFVSS